MRRTSIVAGLVILVLVIGWYEGLYRREASHINALKAKEQAAASTVMGLRTKYYGLVNSEKRLPAEREALRDLTRAVPEGPGLDNLMTTLFGAAAKAGAQLGSISCPQPQGFGSSATGSAATAGPEQLVCTLSVAGTSAEMEHLYNILDAEPRLLVIDNLSLSYGAGSATDTQTISVRAFYASPSSGSAAS
jgi:Tfp pilus assembly protein PilO